MHSIIDERPRLFHVFTLHPRFLSSAAPGREPKPDASSAAMRLLLSVTMKSTLSLFVVSSLLVATTPALAQQTPAAADDIATTKVNLQKCRPQSGTIAFNFDKASIQEVLDQIARIRCMNFILSDQVKGKNDITIVSRTPVTVAAAYAAFLSALEANGMALVPAGAYWKVIERKEAAKAPLPLYDIGKDGVLQRVTPKESRVGEFPNSDAHVTLLYEIRYANKDQVQQLIRNLMTKNADLQAPGGNLLILTDSGSNILRILEVLDKVDISGSSNQLNVITPDYADVASIQQRLQDIYGVADKNSQAPASSKKTSKKAAAEGADAAAADGTAENDDVTDVTITKIIADERTNQLIVICSARAFEKVMEVVRILDKPLADGGGGVRMWVVPLANADAQKASSTLSSLAQGGTSAKKSTDNKAGVKAKEAEKAAALFEGDVKITADETTNALVIVASARDFRALRSVIDQLDVRRPQVFVEAAILEIALNQNRNVGLSAYGSSPLDLPIPGTSGPGILTFANEGGKGLFGQGAKVASGIALLQALERSGRLDQASAQLGLSLIDSLSSTIGLFSFTGPAITLIEDSAGNPVVSFPSVGAVVNLLQGNSNVDILSTPHVMTTDNEKAEIAVGDRVPVVRGFQPVGGAGAIGFGGLQNVAYEDVKLKFSITPHVNADDEVRVELEQEVSDIAGFVTIPNGGNQPIISSRTVKSVVVTADQRTVVIGGLMQDKKSDSESKVPFFGDIPIIGLLFKNWSDTSKKTNLVLLLTPYIVRSEDDFRKVYNIKMKERQAFIDAYFTDARRYDPYIDYDRKSGPLAKLIRAMDQEMKRIENGGPGLESEILIGPGTDGFGDRRIDGGGGGDDGGAGGNNPEASEPPPPPPEAPPAPELSTPPTP
jgi:general secretion pathway protein D